MSPDARRHHLTDQEFSDLLIGASPDGSVAAHLADCDHCRHELEVVGCSLGSLRELSTVWAQAKAPALVAVPSRWARRLVSVPSWGTGLAVTAAAGVVAFGLGLFSERPQAPVSHRAAETAPTKTDLANDNRLMLSIDQELSYQAPLPLAESRAATHHDAHRTAEMILD